MMTLRLRYPQCCGKKEIFWLVDIPSTRAVNTVCCSHDPCSLAVLKKALHDNAFSSHGPCFRVPCSHEPVDTGGKNALVFMGREHGSCEQHTRVNGACRRYINQSENLFDFASLADNVNTTSLSLSLLNYLLFVNFVLLQVDLIIKRLLKRLFLWKTQLFPTSLRDYLCTGVLLVSIANAIVVFRLIYNLMDESVRKNNIFILNMSILLAKLRLKYYTKALQWHGLCTRSVDAVRVHGTKSPTVHTGRKHGRKMWSCSRVVNRDREHGSCEPALKRAKLHLWRPGLSRTPLTKITALPDIPTWLFLFVEKEKEKKKRKEEKKYLFYLAFVHWFIFFIYSLYMTQTLKMI